MNCQKFAGKLSVYQDGALNAEMAEQIWVHLESCAACREELAALERLSGLIRPELAYADAPEGFAQRVMERLPEGRPASKRRSLLAVFGWSAAALLLIVGVLVFRYVFPKQSASTVKLGHPAPVHVQQPERPRMPNKPTAIGPVNRQPLATRDVRGPVVRMPEPSAPRRDSEEVRQTPTPADMERLEELAERYRSASAGIELVRVPIGEEKTATPGAVGKRPSVGRGESKNRKPGVKVVARSQDGRFSIGVTLE